MAFKNCRIDQNQLEDFIHILLDAKERVSRGEAIEILKVGSKPVLMKLSDTIKSDLFEMEIVPDRNCP